MNLSKFKDSIQEGKMPEGLTVYLKSLWLDGNGDWTKAHGLIDQMEDEDAAFLHIGNASYWYRRAGKTKPSIGLEQEWEQMVLYFLDQIKK